MEGVERPDSGTGIVDVSSYPGYGYKSIAVHVDG
jgi:hypothetical protein